MSRVTQLDPGAEVGFRFRPLCHNAMFNPLERSLHLEGDSRLRSDVGVWRLISGYEWWRLDVMVEQGWRGPYRAWQRPGGTAMRVKLGNQEGDTEEL